MPQALDLLSNLDDVDVDWLLEVSNERKVKANEIIINEGAAPDALYIMQSGVAVVSNTVTGGKEIARIGPGELLGELSFVDHRTASASVIAAEDVVLLSVSRKDLSSRISSNKGFAARFFYALSSVIAGRLRNSITLNDRNHVDATHEDNGVEGFWSEARVALHEFKNLLQEADQTAISQAGAIPEVLTTSIRSGFGPLMTLFNNLIGDEASLDIHIKETIGSQLQREFLPYLLLTNTAERMYSKPRGYAGDFLTIEYMYQNQDKGTGRIGPLIERCFLDEPAAKAVRNRRGLLAREIINVLDEHIDQPVNITTLACGPAEEVFDVFSQMENPDRLNVNAIDIDLQALAFVVDKRDRMGLQKRITPHNANLVYLAIGKQNLDIEPQDLIYSIGLIDYFDDKFVVKLLNYSHSMLKPGGKIILGNFHPGNPDKAFMDYILEWKLNHRSEDDMNRLFEVSAFRRPCTKIEFEEEGVNLFATCIKA